MENEKKSSDTRKVRSAMELNWLTMAKCWISIAAREHFFVGSSLLGSAKFKIYLMTLGVIICEEGGH